MTFEEWWPTAPASSSSDWAGATKDYARFGWDAGYKASEEEFYAPLGAEPLPPVMLEALDITRKAVAAQIESEAVALVRELNDALAIPERFQARVDALLDRAEER